MKQIVSPEDISITNTLPSWVEEAYALRFAEEFQQKISQVLDSTEPFFNEAMVNLHEITNAIPDSENITKWGKYLGIIATVSILSGMVSATEAAILSCDRNKIKQQAREGAGGAIKLLEVLNNLDKYIPTIVVLNNMVNTPGGILMASAGSGILNGSIATVISTMAIMFYGEDVAKNIGIAKSEELAKVAARVLPVLRIVLTYIVPLIPIMNANTRITKRAIEKGTSGRIQFPENDEDTTKRNGLQYLTEMLLNGVINGRQFNLLQGIMQFDERKIGDILAKKNKMGEIFSFDNTTTIEEANRIIEESPSYSRIPIFREGHVIGICLKDDILKAAQDEKFMKYPVSRYMSRRVNITTLSDTAPTVLKEFINNKAHINVVVDEQQKPIGVITLEDLIEEFLQDEILDESDIDEMSKEILRDVEKIKGTRSNIAIRKIKKKRAEILELSRNSRVRIIREFLQKEKKNEREIAISSKKAEIKKMLEEHYSLSLEQKGEIFDAIWSAVYEIEKRRPLGHLWRRNRDEQIRFANTIKSKDQQMYSKLCKYLENKIEKGNEDYDKLEDCFISFLDALHKKERGKLRNIFVEEHPEQNGKA